VSRLEGLGNIFLDDDGAACSVDEPGAYGFEIVSTTRRYAGSYNWRCNSIEEVYLFSSWISTLC
jgi:hypothetical protein